MPNPLKDKLLDRLTALQKQRAEKAASFAGQLAQIDGQIQAIAQLGQNWDRLTVDEALAALEKTGIALELKS